MKSAYGKRAKNCREKGVGVLAVLMVQDMTTERLG